MTTLEHLGRAVAERAGNSPPPEVRERVRARVLARGAGRAEAHVGWWRSVAVAALLLVVAGGWLAAGRGDALGASVQGTPLRENDWLTAADQLPLDVTFEDRGHVKLAAQARGRLTKLTRSRVELSLEEGLVEVDVKPKSGTAWTIAAGPYRVEVLGTAFAARWDVARSELDVRVVRGLVRVAGGFLDEQGVQLRAGDSLLANAISGRTVMSRAQSRTDTSAAAFAGAAPEATEARVSAGPELGPSAAAPESPGPPIPEAREQPPARPTPSLKELGQQARYAEIIARAEELGFDSLMSSLPAADLALLADAARYQKQPARARSVLLALRRRFPGSAEGATATFLLGRLAAEQSRDYAGAAKWFGLYSQEHPSGPMAAEACGRRAQLLALAGDREGARAVATEYLAKYPNGPYAAVSRGLLAGQSLKAEP